MNIKVKGSEWLNERGNRSYNSNYVFPKDNNSSSDLYVVCGAVGAGVMYRGEQIAEQVVNEFVSYVAQHAANFESEADAQAELITSALGHTEKALSEYIVLHPECHGIATTLACVHFTHNGAIVGWVGDTRAVLIRNGMSVRQTIDHSTKYPYDDFSLHPRRSINRMIEGAEKPASMDVEWWSDLQPNDIIVLGTYAVMRPLEQGFLSDAWEREHMRDGLKFACDAHARDNYAIYTMRMGEGVTQTVNAEDTLSAIGAGSMSAFAVRDLLEDEENMPLSENTEVADAPSLETETAPIDEEVAETPSLETETAPLDEEVTETPSLETETAPLDEEVTETPSLETETAPIDEEIAETPSLETETAPIDEEVTETPSLETETAPIDEEEVVRVEPAKPLIGAYTYDDEEEEKAGTGFIWSPTNKIEEVADTAKEEVAGGLDAVTAATVAGGTGAAAVLVNSADAVKEKITNIVDFTPVTDKGKTAENNSTPPNTSKSGGFISSWGWVVAACLLGVAVLAYLYTFMLGTGDTDNKVKSADLLKNMRQELYVAKSKDDSLAIYKNYLAKAEADGIDKDSIALIRSDSDAFANLISAQADTTGTGGLAQNSSPNSEKQTVTEASVKTNSKPQIAQNNPTTTNTDKPASDATQPAAAPKKEENKVAGSVQPKAKIISTKPAAGNNTPSPAMQSRQARPTSYAATLPPVPKTDVWKSFDKAWAASEGFRVVKKGNKWGWMHEDGKPFVGLNYEEVGSFKDGIAPLKKGGKWGFTNTAGKVIIAYKYTSVTTFGAACPGLAKVNDGKKVFFIDKTGKEVPACK